MTAVTTRVDLLESEISRLQEIYAREALLRSRGLIPQLVPFALIGLGGLGLAATAVWTVYSMQGLEPAPVELGVILGIGVVLALVAPVLAGLRIIDRARAAPENRLGELQQLVRSRRPAPVENLPEAEVSPAPATAAASAAAFRQMMDDR